MLHDSPPELSSSVVGEVALHRQTICIEGPEHLVGFEKQKIHTFKWSLNDVGD